MEYISLMEFILTCNNYIQDCKKCEFFFSYNKLADSACDKSWHESDGTDREQHFYLNELYRYAEGE